MTDQESKEIKKPRTFKLSIRGNNLVLHRKINLQMLGKILQIIGEDELAKEADL